MIIKNKDGCQDQIDYLSDLMERDLPADKKGLIERELKNLYSGKKGEETSAYYLDFDLKKTKNWALIHDLRIEHDGDVAQIDHLLIGRMMDIYVIESKNFNYGVSISDDGDFSFFYKKRPYAIPSPITQNDRHIRLLDKFLTDNDLLPKRLGITLKPYYRNIVLISPTSRLTKPKKGIYDCSTVMKADKFTERLNLDLDENSLKNMVGMAKIISQKSLCEFAEKLALLHKPVTIDYVAKFGLKDSSNVVTELVDDYHVNPPLCPKCNKEMVVRNTKKGKNIGKKFWGCSDFPTCRGVIDITLPDTSSPLCPKCGENMVKRTSKKGKNIGKEFWGCSKFPKCFGSIQIES